MSIDAASGPGRRAAGACAEAASCIVSIRTEPRSFNRHAARDTSTDLVSKLTHAAARSNRSGHASGRAVARRGVDDAAGGTRVTMTLKRGVVFSDGQPFTADDVVFAFQAVYDERAAARWRIPSKPVGRS